MDDRLGELLKQLSTQAMTRREFVKRAAALGLSMGAIGSILVACGGGAATPAATETATAAATATAASGGSGNATEILFWHQEAVPERIAVFQKFIDAFNKANPDVVVRQESQGWDVAFAKLVSALKAGNAPDVMLSLPAMTMTFQNRGDIIPLDDLVTKLDEKYKYVPSQLTPFKYKGATWGIPMWGMTFLWHYRTDALQEAGVEVPKTWTEWLDASTKMTKDGKYGIVLPANKNLFTTECFYTFLISAKSDVYGADGKINFNTPETVDALTFYKDMLKTAPPDAASYDWGTFEQALLRGICLSANNFSSWAAAMEATPFKDSWGAAAQPVMEGGQRGQIHYPNNLMVFKASEAKLEAIGRFAEFFLEPSVNGEWLANMQPTLYLPITEAAQKSNTFWDHPVIAKNKAMVELQLQELPYGQLYGFRTPDAYNPSVGELEGSGVLGEIVQKMVIDNETPQAAAEWGQKRLQEVLKVA